MVPEKTLAGFLYTSTNGESINQVLKVDWFSDDGSKLAVSTWGLAHFGTALTSLDEQHSSRVDVYDFANGNITGERIFEEVGSAGTYNFLGLIGYDL